MAAAELDPLFVKGLRLLHSKSKDSADQLKLLLDDAIAHSKQSVYAKDRMYTSVKLVADVSKTEEYKFSSIQHLIDVFSCVDFQMDSEVIPEATDTLENEVVRFQEGESKLHLKKAPREISDASSFTAKHPSEDIRERKPEKRQSEKGKDSSESLLEAKIPKLESPQVFSYYPPSPDIPKLEQYVPKKEEDTDSSDENADADDFAMEMGLACVICKQIDVTQGNQLIECQECHSLYHQECHRPPAFDYDVNDPRRVWYCAKCLKNMKKMATKTQKTAKSVAAVITKEPVSQAKCTKNESSPPSLILPFKRTEKPTMSQGSNQTSANKPIGLAGLAANFGGRTTASTAATSLPPSTRGAKTSSAGAGVKALTSAFSSPTTVKTPSLTNSSTLLTKMTSSSSAFQTLSLTTTSQSTVASSTQKPSTTSSSAKGLGLLSAAVASTSGRNASSAPSGNGNSGHKVASCSPLMSADKRLQIMKKRASKLQEKRRLSSK